MDIQTAALAARLYGAARPQAGRLLYLRNGGNDPSTSVSASPMTVSRAAEENGREHV